MDDLNYMLEEGKGAYLCDLGSISWKKYLNPHMNYVIGEEKYVYELPGNFHIISIGYTQSTCICSVIPINPDLTETRDILFNM